MRTIKLTAIIIIMAVGMEAADGISKDYANAHQHQV